MHISRAVSTGVKLLSLFDVSLTVHCR